MSPSRQARLRQTYRFAQGFPNESGPTTPQRLSQGPICQTSPGPPGINNVAEGSSLRAAQDHTALECLDAEAILSNSARPG